MKICTVVGARPQFIKTVSVSRALLALGQVELVIHTGQHYDPAMSQIFFDEIVQHAPDYHLGVGSGPHGVQTGQMLVALEPILETEKPDWVLLYGDTNSTLAGALAACKLHLPIAHVEAGERSFDRRMPEEINRLIVDCVADVHLCASQAAVRNLAAEGHADSAHWVGDVMLDELLACLPSARRLSTILGRLGLQPKCYSLVTLHRAATVDEPKHLTALVEILNGLTETIVFPVHPRTRHALSQRHLVLAEHIRAIEPVGYLDMLALEDSARLIATDSGGVQREAYYLGIPCLTLRNETEWTATVETGWNRLVGIEPQSIKAAWHTFTPPGPRPPIYGEGTAGQRIAELLVSQAAERGRGCQCPRPPARTSLKAALAP